MFNRQSKGSLSSRGVTSLLVAGLLLVGSANVVALTGCAGSTAATAPVAAPNTPTTPVTLGATTFAPGLVGVAYSKTLLANGGSAPFTFSLVAGTMPAGTSINSAGVISGTPLVAGTSNFTLQLTDSSFPQGSVQASYTWLVEGPLVLTGGALAGGTAGVAYTQPVAATGGFAPFTYSITTGTLPTGLTLSAAGTIIGTPTSAGASSFTIQAVDSSSTPMKTSAMFTLQIAATPVAITTATVPAALQNLPYSATFAATGGTAPIKFAVSAGTLPAGLTLASTGAITGTPTLVGSSTFSVTATDSSAIPLSATMAYTIPVTGAPLTITATTLPNAIVNSSYMQALTIVGGTTPYTYTVSAGTLPAGLTFAAGALSGTPTTVGANSFTLTVTDSSKTAQTASLAVTLNVVNATVLVNTALPLATVPATAYGIHTSVYSAILSDATNLPGLLKTDGVNMMRYPGGIYADFYHWAQYSLTSQFASQAPACAYVPSGYANPMSDFGHFVKTLQASGAQAVITVNYGTSLGDSMGTKKSSNYGGVACSEPLTGGQPQEAAAWVAYANGLPTNTTVIGIDAAGFNWQTVGFWASLRAATPLATDDGYNFLRIGLTAPIGVKYWEVGNEIFYNGYNPYGGASEVDVHAPYVYPNGYGTYAAPNTNYVSRIGLATIGPAVYGTNAETFVSAMKAIDSTIKIGLTMSSPNVDPIPSSWNPAVLQAACTSGTFDFLILHYYPGTYNAVTGAQLLSLPQTALPTLVSNLKTQLATSCSSFASKVQFFMTETGANGNFVANTPVQINGLYAGHVYLTGFESGIANVDWLELQNGNPGTYLSPAEAEEPAYYGIQMAHLLAAPGDALVTATPSTGSGIVAHASLQAAGAKGVMLINSSATAASVVSVTVSGATLGATATQYSYGLNTTQTGAALVGTSLAMTGNTFVVTVPAYTMVELVIQ